MLQLESMPYDDEYLAMVDDVFKDNIQGHFYRGYTILGGTEKKLHFTLVKSKVSHFVFFNAR